MELADDSEELRWTGQAESIFLQQTAYAYSIKFPSQVDKDNKETHAVNISAFLLDLSEYKEHVNSSLVCSKIYFLSRMKLSNMERMRPFLLEDAGKHYTHYRQERNATAVWPICVSTICSVQQNNDCIFEVLQKFVLLPTWNKQALLPIDFKFFTMLIDLTVWLPTGLLTPVIY